ncbi:TonB-dependent receptor domain-containing protein, partial [Steroidobacter sp.]|uniref:TonB-dependent receptor domain-containing protein n=1 Tax=Steroidobacter sp. TaxID=1978227 RepID=UPI001A48017B
MNRCLSNALAVALALSGASVSLPSPASAAGQAAVTVDLPAQSLAAALRELARQADIQIAVQSELTDGRTAPKLSGKYSPADALQALLQGSDLVAYQINAHTFGIRSIHTNPSGANVESAERIRLAQAEASNNEVAQLEEVIVTATKRLESVRNISGSVSALTGTELGRLGAQSMQDYLTRTPGVVFNGGTPGYSTAVIRGISTTTGTDQGQGTTGYFIDDVPLTDPYFSLAIPDIDAFDVGNVTVLRGPQGTLFGSASLGGAINYQTAKPDTRAWDMRAETTAADVADGGVDWSGKVMVNAPLIADQLAVRGTYVYRNIAGYIDNVGTGEKDVNETVIRGGRVQALWTPTERTKIGYLFLDQLINTQDDGFEQPSLGELRKDSVVAEFNNFETVIHNLRLDHDFGASTLTVSAAHHKKTMDTYDDITLQFGAPGVIFPGIGFPLVELPSLGKSSGKTFEVRLASNTQQRFEYLVGAMRDDTRMRVFQAIYVPGIGSVLDTVFGPGAGQLLAPGDELLSAAIPLRGVETAVFGEASYRFNDRWKLTLGGRAFDTEVDTATITKGLASAAQPGESLYQSADQDERGFTPKASITFTPNDRFMAYALASQGFRYGGPNIAQSEPGFTVPRGFKSDSLWNYEIGTRSTLLDRRLQLDGTLFYVDWSDIQLRQRTPAQINYAANAGKARSYGFEGTLNWAVSRSLSLSGNVTYLNAQLNQDFVSNPGNVTPALVPAGTTLPGASKWAISDALSYTWSNHAFEPS